MSASAPTEPTDSELRQAMMLLNRLIFGVGQVKFWAANNDRNLAALIVHLSGPLVTFLTEKGHQRNQPVDSSLYPAVTEWIAEWIEENGDKIPAATLVEQLKTSSYFNTVANDLIPSRRADAPPIAVSVTPVPINSPIPAPPITPSQPATDLASTKKGTPRAATAVTKTSRAATVTAIKTSLAATSQEAASPTTVTATKKKATGSAAKVNPTATSSSQASTINSQPIKPLEPVIPAAPKKSSRRKLDKSTTSVKPSVASITRSDNKRDLPEVEMHPPEKETEPARPRVAESSAAGSTKRGTLTKAAHRPSSAELLQTQGEKCARCVRTGAACISEGSKRWPCNDCTIHDAECEPPSSSTIKTEEKGKGKPKQLRIQRPLMFDRLEAVEKRVTDLERTEEIRQARMDNLEMMFKRLVESQVGSAPDKMDPLHAAFAQPNYLEFGNVPLFNDIMKEERERAREREQAQNDKKRKRKEKDRSDDIEPAEPEPKKVKSNTALSTRSTSSESEESEKAPNSENFSDPSQPRSPSSNMSQNNNDMDIDEGAKPAREEDDEDESD